MNDVIFFVTGIATDYLIPGVIAITFIVAFFSAILCIHFNYHYFIIHGKLLWGMACDSPTEVEKVTKLTALQWEVGIGDATLVTTIVALIGILASIIWPIVLLLLLMLVLLHTMKFIFRGRHRRLMFKLKLKGFYNDE